MIIYHISCNCIAQKSHVDINRLLFKLNILSSNSDYVVIMISNMPNLSSQHKPHTGTTVTDLLMVVHCTNVDCICALISAASRNVTEQFYRSTVLLLKSEVCAIIISKQQPLAPSKLSSQMTRERDTHTQSLIFWVK